jgi:hypothetical protein
VELASLSAPRNKSSSSPKAILTSPSGVQLVVRQERQSVTVPVVATATGLARCSPQCVLSAVRRQKYRLSPARVDPYIAASATTKSE